MEILGDFARAKRSPKPIFDCGGQDCYMISAYSLSKNKEENIMFKSLIGKVFLGLFLIGCGYFVGIFSTNHSLAAKPFEYKCVALRSENPGTLEPVLNQMSNQGYEYVGLVVSTMIFKK